MRVLCLDIEGGYGGSSRSLFESVRHLPGDIETEIWCRREGPIRAQYARIGVACRTAPDMPHISSVPRLSRNLYTYARFAFDWRKSESFRRDLARVACGCFDLVHFNHEGLFLLARWLRAELGSSARMTAHVRTHLPSTFFSRWQYRQLADATDQLIFITEMEQNNVARLTGRALDGPVIHNIVSTALPSRPDLSLAAERCFKVVSVSNYAWQRGNDRLIDIASAIKDQGRRDVLFVVAGRMELSRSLPGDVGRIARRGGTLADYAEARGVGNMFRFLGHVSDPAPVLAACDLLVRPSRGDDPWGREVLEAMALGLPVIATGRYNRFVEDGVTGILHPEYDAQSMAKAILDLADSRGERDLMGRRARARITASCDGPTQAEELATVWRGIVS